MQYSVKVIDAPIITWETVSDTTVCFGGEVHLAVTPNSNGYYTWYRNGQLITGANLNQLFDSPVAVDMDSTSYRYDVMYTPLVAG